LSKGESNQSRRGGLRRKSLEMKGGKERANCKYGGDPSEITIKQERYLEKKEWQRRSARVKKDAGMS